MKKALLIMISMAPAMIIATDIAIKIEGTAYLPVAELERVCKNVMQQPTQDVIVTPSPAAPVTMKPVPMVPIPMAPVAHVPVVPAAPVITPTVPTAPTVSTTPTVSTAPVVSMAPDLSEKVERTSPEEQSLINSFGETEQAPLEQTLSEQASPEQASPEQAPGAPAQ